MSLCPSFYCTPCGKAHADECPPAPVKKKFPPGFVIEPKAGISLGSPKQVLCACGTWTSNSSGVCRYCPPALPNIASFPNQPISPLPAMKIFSPTTGTLWTSESRLRETDPWQVGNPNFYYRVIGHPQSAVKLEAVDAATHQPGTARDYPYGHWLPDGDIFQGVYLRFVFKP